jgi:hypothetical protein
LYKILVRKGKGKRLVGRPRHRWDDNVRLNQEQNAKSWAESAYVAVGAVQWQVIVNKVINVRFP